MKQYILKFVYWILRSKFVDNGDVMSKYHEGRDLGYKEGYTKALKDINNIVNEYQQRINRK